MAGCACHLDIGSEDSKLPMYLHFLIAAPILPVYAGLILYNLVFKSGGFDGSTADSHYIQSLQDIQTKRWFRTYTNILLAVLMAVTCFALTFTWSSTSTTLNLIAGGVALLVLVPTPRRIAPKKIVYDRKAVAESRKGLFKKFSTIVNWNSTKYQEEAARALNLKNGVEGWHEIKNIVEIPMCCA